MQNAILRNFRKVVTPQFISETAHKTAFNKRVTAQISGVDFARMLISQVGSGHELNYTNLNATLCKLNRNVNISNQSLSEYFYKKSSVELLKSIYEKVFSAQKKILSGKCINHISHKIFDLFHRILIEDSTTCILNEKLKTSYKGSGGAASKSSLKIDVIHELKTAAILKISISQGNVPDVSLGKSLLSEVVDGDLVLRDLGYFKIDNLNEISNKNAYFISRYKSDVNVYLNKESDKATEIGAYLKAAYDKFPNQIVDINVRVGATKLEVRLIAYKVPPEISNQRRRKANREAACQGTTCSQARLSLCDFVILITNIPKDLLEASIIGTFYRIRWTIELIFKMWKSQLNLQKSLMARKENCILCFIYTTLILCLLTAVIHGWLNKIIDPFGKEISLDKLSKWLVNRNGCFMLCFGSVLKLEIEIQKDLRKIKMQKRKRKTSAERVNCSEGYGEKYVVNI